MQPGGSSLPGTASRQSPPPPPRALPASFQHQRWVLCSAEVPCDVRGLPSLFPSEGMSSLPPGVFLSGANLRLSGNTHSAFSGTAMESQSQGPRFYTLQRKCTLLGMVQGKEETNIFYLASRSINQSNQPGGQGGEVWLGPSRCERPLPQQAHLR